METVAVMVVEFGNFEGSITHLLMVRVRQVYGILISDGDVALLFQTMKLPSSPCEGEAGPLLLSSSSIICSVSLSSSSIVLAGEEAVVADTVDCTTASPDGPAPLLSSTVMTQLESARAPARFCQTPMWDFSVSRRRQVRDGDGALQHLRSLALRTWDRLLVDEEELPPRTSWVAAGAGSPVLLLCTGKLVLALRPLIRTAASS